MIKKKLRKISDGLMFYFTKKEIEIYGLIEGDEIIIPDMLKQKPKRKKK